MPEEQIPLIPEEPYNPPKDFDLTVKLLEQVTKISLITDYLKSKNLTHSAGSWADLKNKRLLVSLQKGEISFEELVKLLAEAEEFGRCHTFLFRCDPALAQSLIEKDRVTKLAGDLGISSCLGIGRVLDQPDVPTITSIRTEDDKRAKILTIKVIEKRIEHDYIGPRVVGSIFVKKWRIQQVRAVNVVRLFSVGVLEVRIASHDSKRYDDDVARILEKVAPFIPRKGFKDFSLADAKTALWDQKSTTFKDRVRFSQSTLVSESSGSSVKAACGEENGDLFSDQAFSAGLDELWKSDEVTCESSNVYWLKGKSGSLPTEEIHTILPPVRNEFAIPAHCSKADYEYVFDQLRALSK